MSLHSLFEPKSVAIIGASEKEGSVGRIVTANMVKANFTGILYPINPKYDSILGVKAYSKVLDIESSIDLAVITTPAKTIPEILIECGKKKIPTVIIISAGFKETGEEGRKLEETVIEIARTYGIRILGPNCLGCMNPRVGLNASFAAGCGMNGNIAFLSQSGALCTAFLDWSLEKKLGLSAFVSLGSMSDIQWFDLLEYLEKDPFTEAIFMYVETIGDAENFKKVAAKVAKNKPIFVLKGGKTEASAKAAASHTGSLAGDDDLFSFAMIQLGICRIETIRQFFDVALFVGKQPKVAGKNLTIITNAGGPGVLAVDAAIRSGALLSTLSKESFKQLDQLLPPCWSQDNPVDVLGDADVHRYEKAIEICANDVNTNGILVILTPQDMTDCKAIALATSKAFKKNKKPIIVSWMGAESVASSKEVFKEAGIGCFDTPDEAAATFGIICSHFENMKKPPFYLPHKNINKSNGNGDFSVSKGGKILSETASKEWVFEEGFPVVKNYIAKTPEQACELAEKIGFPVVIKLHSESITHKSDVGGVKLNLGSLDAVKQAYIEIEQSLHHHGLIEAFEGVSVQKMILDKGVEVIIGSTTDPQWGPVILFGAGGEYVEIYKDRTLGIAPLTKEYAMKMLEETKIYSILKGYRGKKSCDLAQLCELLVKFSDFIFSTPSIKECDLNPLVVTPESCMALDARIVLK